MTSSRPMISSVAGHESTSFRRVGRCEAGDDEVGRGTREPRRGSVRSTGGSGMRRRTRARDGRASRRRVAASASTSQRSNAGAMRVADRGRARGRRGRTRGGRAPLRVRARAGTAARRDRATSRAPMTTTAITASANVGSACAGVDRRARDHASSSPATGRRRSVVLAVEVAVERGPRAAGLAGDVVEGGLGQPEARDADQGAASRIAPRPGSESSGGGRWRSSGSSR